MARRFLVRHCSRRFSQARSVAAKAAGSDAFAVSVDAAWIERFSVWFREVIGAEYPQERCAKSSTRPDHLLRPDQRVEILAADIAEAERRLA
jgi:hypothetical protein